MNSSQVFYLHFSQDEVKFDGSKMVYGRKNGHWATGDLGLEITSIERLLAAKELIVQAFEVQS